jgi:type IX secretion system PorP/SprF family membrane protein
MRLSNHSTAAGTQQLPKSKRIIHGFGSNIFQSSYGVVKSIGANVSYSLNYPISEKARLAFGVSTLVENRKLDVAQVSVRDPDEFYNYLLRSSTSQTDLNVRAGVLFYGENFYVGLSYLPVINFAIQSSELAMDKPFYRGSFQFGYSFPVSSEITLKPSVLGLVQMNNHLVVDYNVKAFIQNKVWLGLSYRDIKSGVVILGFNLNEKFTFSYAYEMSMGQFQKFNDGSHELVLAARLNNLKRYSQYIW